MKTKTKPRCEVCGKTIQGVKIPGEKAYCSRACMNSAELLDLRKSREYYDARRARFIRTSWIIIALIVMFFFGVVVGERVVIHYLQTNPDMMQVCRWLVAHAG